MFNLGVPRNLSVLKKTKEKKQYHYLNRTDVLKRTSVTDDSSLSMGAEETS